MTSFLLDEILLLSALSDSDATNSDAISHHACIYDIRRCWFDLEAVS
jgi:hypothetical protein